MGEASSLLDVEQFGAKLDWVTLTTPKNADDAEHFRQFAWHYMERERERWGEGKTQTIAGYSGDKTGDTFFGSRHYDGHEMLVCSGEESNRLVEELIIHEVPARVRRIDARVLARASSSNFNYPEQVRQSILAAGTAEGKKRHKKVNLFGSARGSDGITVGARSSEKYVRIYDHDAKHCGGARGVLYAHEGEYKGRSAESFFEGYKNAPNRAAFCAGVVRSTLQSMRVPCDWLKDVQEAQIVVGRKITTNESRLAYQEKIGIPMLVDLVNGGCSEQVKALLEAAGLDQLFKA